MSFQKKLKLTVISTFILSSSSFAANIFVSHPAAACSQGRDSAKCGSFGTIRGEDRNIDDEGRKIDWDISFTFAFMKSKNYKNESDYHLWIQSTGNGIGVTKPGLKSTGAAVWDFGPLLSFSLQSSISHNGINSLVLKHSPQFNAQSVSVSQSYSVSGTIGSSPSGGIGASSSISRNHEQRLISANVNNQGDYVSHRITYTPDLSWHYGQSSPSNWSGANYVRHVPLDINNLYTFEGLQPNSEVNYNYNINNLKATMYYSGTFATDYFKRSVYSFNTVATPLRGSFKFRAF